MHEDLYTEREASGVIDRLLAKDPNLLGKEEDINTRFFWKRMGEVNLEKMGIFPSMELYIGATQWQVGLWTNKKVAEADFKEAEKSGTMPPFIAECVFKKVKGSNGSDRGEAQYSIREEDETVVRIERRPSPSGFKSEAVNDLYRADFVRYLRKKQPSRAKKILDGLRQAYEEFMGTGAQYHVENVPWDRQTNKKMTPKQKLTVVLEHAGLDLDLSVL